METFIEENKAKYIYIFTDCFLTKGYTRTSIIDISRRRIFFIPNSFYELTRYFRKHTIEKILERLEDNESKTEFYKFLNFLLKEHLASLVDDISRFPELENYWDHPSPITNAIIDVKNEYDYLPKAIVELSELRCEYLQIRFYATSGNRMIENIAGMVKGRCFKDVEILLKFNKNQFSEAQLLRICESQKNIHFLIHSVPMYTSLMSNKHIRYSNQQWGSCNNCGVISAFTLRIPSLQGFMENKLFNSCLNRKISIDENGDIGNCPSMKKKYGSIRIHSLSEIAGKASFKKIAMITKDMIDGCRDCEFRYICSDCRAHTIDGKFYSKPAECSYDPYSGVWEEV